MIGGGTGKLEEKVSHALAKRETAPLTKKDV